MLTLDDLTNVDADVLVDLLDITAEELLEAFPLKVQELLKDEQEEQEAVGYDE